LLLILSTGYSANHGARRDDGCATMLFGSSSTFQPSIDRLGFREAAGMDDLAVNRHTGSRKNSMPGEFRHIRDLLDVDFDA
jgi:hypothetical protein